MSVDSWRQQVSTSEGCKVLFQSVNFKTDLLKCLSQLHQNPNNNEIDINANFQRIILLYRTIRNLASINEHSEWIIIESNIVSDVFEYLNKIFNKLMQVSFSTSANTNDDDLFVSFCDIIRAGFQLLCNLSFHEFDVNHNKDNIHSVLWRQFYSPQSANFILLWIDQLLKKLCKDNNKGILLQTNMSRILEPICALLHQFVVNQPDAINDKDLNIVTKILYKIQLIDVKCFGNNKNYLYQRTETENKSSDDNKSQDEDDFDKWKHHQWIRKCIPYFINSNGLIFYIDALDEKIISLYYFQVSIELLFEMSESILIDIKTPSLQEDVRLMQRQKIHLIQHILKPTFEKIINVVDFSLKRKFPPIFNNKQRQSEHANLINICANILETMSNVSLISSSIQDKDERIKYQYDLMNSIGSVIVESLKMLQNEADQLTKYCKDNKISDTKFNEEYAETIPKILSFRRQFVSIISTLCCNNKLNQDYIRNNGIIEMLLNMTKIDGFSMFLQQWSIFAIKNITSGSIENQKYIQNIKAQKVIQNDEMKNLGVKITYDEITGKIVAKKDDTKA